MWPSKTKIGFLNYCNVMFFEKLDFSLDVPDDEHRVVSRVVHQTVKGLVNPKRDVNSDFLARELSDFDIHEFLAKDLSQSFDAHLSWSVGGT